MHDHSPSGLSRAQRRDARLARQKQIEQRYRKDRQRNVLARPGAHEFVFVLDHLKAGFNVPKIFRSAQAFGAAAIHLVNIGVFDPAPAKGAFRKVPARFHERFEQAWQALDEAGYTCFALTAEGDQALPDAVLPRRSAFIVGHEELGLSFDPADFPGMRTLRIPLYGEMESLNASVAASIAMYEYVRQHAERNR